MIKIENFNFLIGNWSITNKMLKERFCKSNEWIEFSSVTETRKSLNGLIVMDELKTPYLGNDFRGLSIRMFNPKTKEWTIYWADTMHPELKITEQVVGKFTNGIGMFYGEEIFGGQKVKQKFTWKLFDLDTAYWNQAYFDEEKEEWEANWIMKFNRIK